MVPSSPSDLSFPPGSVVESQGVGTLPGELTVNAFGQPSYTLPLLVPEGRAGIQPSLALHYGGGNDNGSIGVGWSLSGIPSITPCRKTVAQDGQPDGVKFGPGDEYCLNGTRLVAVEGTAGASGAVYRLEQDNLTKIVSLGSVPGMNVPESFEAQHPNGEVWVYGRRIVAKQKVNTDLLGHSPSTRDVVWAWALERVEDRTGNSMSFDYDVVPHTGAPSSLGYDDQYALEYYPQEIRYTFHKTGLPAYRRVHFYYENRPDPVDRYMSGVHVRTSRRLSTIEASAPNPTTIEPVWNYRLTYSQSPLNGRSRVNAITMCDAHGACLPSTELIWQNGYDNYVERSTGVSAGTDLNQMPKTRAADFNGDGKTDLLFWDGTRQKCLIESDGPHWVDDNGVGGFCNEPETYNVDGEWKIAYSNGSTFGTPVATGLQAGFVTRLGPYAAEDTITGPQEYNPPLALDFDGDGAADLLSARTGEVRSPFRGNALLDTIGSAYVGAPANWEPDVRYFGDFDGDGRIDLFANVDRPVPVLSLTSEGNQVTGWTGPTEWSDYHWAFRRGAGAPGFGTNAASTITPYTQRYDADLAGLSVDSRRLSITTDLDGDGRMELVVPQPGGSYQSVELDGSGNPTTPENVNLSYLAPALPGTSAYGAFSPTYLDINGDGLRDVIAANGVRIDATGAIELPARINTGRGFGPWYLATVGGYQPPDEQRDSLQMTRETQSGLWPANPMPDDGVRIFDFNSDGLDDFMVPTDTGPVIYVSDGRQFAARPAAFTLTNPVLETVYDEMEGITHGWYYGWTHQFADVSGDGQADFVEYDQATREFKVWIRAGQIPDKLINVRNGLNRNESVVFEPTSNVKIYRPGTGCTFPVRCLRAGGQVVSMYTRSAPGGLTYTFYDYEDARTDVQGRGYLGFGRRHEFQTDSGRDTNIEYGIGVRQHGAYPLAATPIARRDDEAIDSAVTRVETEDTNYDVDWSFGNRVFRVRPHDVAQRTYEFSGSAPATLDPSKARRTKLTTNTWDSFGNLTNQDVRKSGSVVPESGGAPIPATGTRTVLHTTYDNRTTDWLIGLPTQREVTSYAAPPDTRSEKRTTQLVPDAQGRIERVIVEPSDPRLRKETVYHYGSYGQVDSIDELNSPSDPEAPYQVRTEQLKYDAEYLYPKQYKNALGHVTKVAVHPALGRTVVLQDPNGFRIDKTYDGFGRERRTEYASGYVTTTDYEVGYAGPYLVRHRSNTGEETTSEYDSVGLAFRLTAKSFNGKPAILERMFDVLGNLKQQSNVFRDYANRRWTNYQRDGLNRVVRIDFPDGSHATKRPQLDELRTWDQLGNESFLRFDVSGRVTDSVDVLMSSGARKLIRTRYGYLPFDLAETITDDKGNVRTLGYDTLGRQTSVNDPDAGLRTMIYSGFGELIAQQDPVSRDMGKSTTYDRDLLGRVKRRSSIDGSDTYTWDAPPAGSTGTPWIGVRHATKSSDGIETRTQYDAYGRPSRDTTVVDGKDYDVDYHYDAESRLERVDYPKAPGTPRFSTKMSYGMNGALAEVDDLGTGKPLWIAKQRDAIGRVEDEMFGNGIETQRKFEIDTGRLAKIDGRTSSGGLVYGFDYKYDANGNLNYRHDAGLGRVDTFEHDSLDRLTQWTRKRSGAYEYRTTYEYDTLGNLNYKHLTGGGLDLAEKLKHYASGPQPNALIGYQRSSSGSVVEAFTPKYDKNGRRAQAPWSSVKYKSFDLPSRVEKAGKVHSYYYNADQERVLEKTPDGMVVSIGQLYQFRVDDHDKVHTFRVSSDTEAVAEYVYSEKTGSKKYRYLHGDHVGSGAAVTDAGGGLVERRQFSPFGDKTDNDGLPAFASPSADFTSGFTGHDHDAELGLVNMRGRMYDPLSSSFLTPDPLVSAPLYGQAYNRYSYVWNTPLKYTDPTGFEPEYDPDIGMNVDEDPQGSSYPGLEPSDMEFTFPDSESGASDSQSANDGGEQSSDADSPPGGDDNVDPPTEAEEQAAEGPTRLEQTYQVMVREAAWNTMDHGRTWTPGTVGRERVAATITLHIAFADNEQGQRQAYFDPTADVEIAINPTWISPTITVTGTPRTIGTEPEVAFTITIADSSTVGSTQGTTTNSGSATVRGGASSEPLGVTVTSPSQSRSQSTSRQSTQTRSYRARGVVRERSLHAPRLPERASLPEHTPSPANLPPLSARIRLRLESSRPVRY